jgi:hypothetical protein
MDRILFLDPEESLRLFYAQDLSMALESRGGFASRDLMVK